jgi:hypothetical protein
LLVLTPLLPCARQQQKQDGYSRSIYRIYRRSTVPISALALCGSLVFGMACSPVARAQAAAPASPLAPQDSEQGLLLDWAGLQVVNIVFDGVSAALLTPLPSQLPQQAGAPLDPAKIRGSLRLLYATGLYETIEVAGVRAGDNVSIIFSGVPRLFVGRVNIEGVKDERLAAVLQSATQLQPGTAYSESKTAQAEPEVTATLQNNGFYRGQVASTRSSTGQTRWSISILRSRRETWPASAT